jgi:hypothetical protein
MDRNPEGPGVEAVAAQGRQKPSQQEREGNGEQQTELA